MNRNEEQSIHQEHLNTVLRAFDAAEALDQWQAYRHSSEICSRIQAAERWANPLFDRACELYPDADVDAALHPYEMTAVALYTALLYNFNASPIWSDLRLDEARELLRERVWTLLQRQPWLRDLAQDLWL